MATKKAKKVVKDDDIEDIEDTSADFALDPRAAASKSTLDRGPERVTKLLVGLAGSHAARALLAKRGWSEAAATEGRNLLTAVLSPAPTAAEMKLQRASDTDDQAVAEAVKTLDSLDEGHFGIAKTALLFNHVPQHDFVFHNLSASTGTASVAGWRTFLTRVRALRTGEGRDAESRKGDLAALALLAERGLSEAELARIERLVEIAEGVGATIQASDAEAEKVARVRLERLWAWYAQWVSVARVEIKSRALRIRLGLAKRRVRARDEDEGDEGGEGEETEPTV